MHRFIILFAIAIITLSALNCAQAQTVVRDDEVERVISKLMLPLFKAAQMPSESVKIYLVQDPSPNAMVQGGQNIFITTGMLTYSDDPHALLGVLAHELSHIKAGHLITSAIEAKNLSQKMMLGMLAGAIAGFATKSPEVAIGAIQTSQDNMFASLMQYSQSQENAADAGAIKILTRANIATSGLEGFLQYLGTQERPSFRTQDFYLRTHPLTSSRLDTLRSHSVTQDTGVPQDLKQKFARSVIKVFAFTNNPEQVLRTLEKENTINAKYAKAIAHYRLGHKDTAIALTDEILRSEPNNPYFHELKGQIYLEAPEIDKAVKHYEMAYNMQKSSDILRIEYADVLMMKSPSNAPKVVKLMEMNINHDLRDPTSWLLLSKAYQALKEQGNAGIALGFYSCLTGDLQTAKKYLAAAKKLGKTNKQITLRLQQLESMVSEMSVTED